MHVSRRLTGSTARYLPMLLLTIISGCAIEPSTPGLSRQQGDEILSELRELRTAVKELQRAQQEPRDEDSADKPVEIAGPGPHALGSPTATLVLVEYTDYQCPFCKRFHDNTLPELKQKYIDTGKLRYEVRDLPLSFHASAMPAALAAYCAGEQGKFWPVHEALFHSQDALSAATARQTAINLGISEVAFDACVSNPATRQHIEANVAEAERIGVNGTPGFILGERHGERLSGSMILGAQPAAAFEQKIETMLSAGPGKP